MSACRAVQSSEAALPGVWDRDEVHLGVVGADAGDELLAPGHLSSECRLGLNLLSPRGRESVDEIGLADKLLRFAHIITAGVRVLGLLGPPVLLGGPRGEVASGHSLLDVLPVRLVLLRAGLHLGEEQSVAHVIDTFCLLHLAEEHLVLVLDLVGGWCGQLLRVGLGFVGERLSRWSSAEVLLVDLP